MEITLNTRVYDILKKYGDIAEVMEVFGVKRVGPYSLRRILTRFITVKRAAFVHRVPPDNFLKMVQNAVKNSVKSKCSLAIQLKCFAINNLSVSTGSELYKEITVNYH